LIESELFGHAKGAFTGAGRDRSGWLEECGPSHTVFLDEVGELSPAIQVKLLRVLQSREFQRVGETRPRRFEGKVIAATNRDLGREVREGRFRRDFYYRLCADLIRTPTLAEQVRGDRDELAFLVRFIAQRFYAPVAESLVDEVMAWVGRRLPPDYPWRGNMRELEQCVRNVLVRREYHPLEEPDAKDGAEADVLALRLTAAELLGWYCERVHAQTGSYAATAARLGIDRRTVKQHIDRHTRRQRRE
jgi:transcriptional regulator with GAF, ATPase, and Fis domain